LTLYAGAALALDIVVVAAVIAPIALNNVHSVLDRIWSLLALAIALACLGVIVRDPRVDDWMEGRTPVGGVKQ
jgi:hypothetical protein